MPSSFVDAFAPIVHALVDLKPLSVLDVGPGWGKYGLACREYVSTLERLMAVEVPEGRLPTQDVIYDEVYTGDVRVFPNREFWQRFDLVLLIDVIEHMRHDDGERLLDRMIRAGCRVLVSTPKIFMEQHDPNNPHEEHLCLWTWDELLAIKGVDLLADASTIDSIIYVLGEK
jgi:hypothetical protein